jgi:hypothetical protein
MKGGGVGMRGIVSALSLQPSPENADTGMLAAGTWTRWVGLYDMAGLGGTVATWSIAEAADKDAGIGGAGVTQTAWSSCGRYLYVVERKSKGVLVYDVRVTGKLVGWLAGREAMTNQRLGVDVFESEKGMEVWAGGLDGVVRVWEEVGMSEGMLETAWEWKAHDGELRIALVVACMLILLLDPVTSSVVHSSGTVMATCSGQRRFPDTSLDLSDSDTGDEEGSFDEDDPTSDPSSNTSSRSSPSVTSRKLDNSIRVWSL